MQVVLRIHPESKRPRIVDVATGDEVAVRIRGLWIDPYGGTFSDAERITFNDLLGAWEEANGLERGNRE